MGRRKPDPILRNMRLNVAFNKTWLNKIKERAQANKCTTGYLVRYCILKAFPEWFSSDDEIAAGLGDRRRR